MEVVVGAFNKEKALVGAFSQNCTTSFNINVKFVEHKNMAYP